MNAYQFSQNPYDNQKVLQEYFESLSPSQQVALFMQLAEKFHRASCSRDELAQTVERINRQYDRCLTRIAVLQKELNEARYGQEQAA